MLSGQMILALVGYALLLVGVVGQKGLDGLDLDWWGQRRRRGFQAVVVFGAMLMVAASAGK